MSVSPNTPAQEIATMFWQLMNSGWVGTYILRQYRLRRIGQKQYWVDSTSPLPKKLNERIIELDVYNTLWQKWDCQVTTDCEERANGAQRELMSAVLRPTSAHTSFLFTDRCGNFHRIFSLCFLCELLRLYAQWHDCLRNRGIFFHTWHADCHAQSLLVGLRTSSNINSLGTILNWAAKLR